MRYGIFVALGLIAACGGTNAKRVGEACVATSECDKALLCNQTHVCAQMGSPDAGVGSNDAARQPTDAHALDAFVQKDAPLDAFVFLDAL